MQESNTPTPLPEPNSGQNNPDLSVVPGAESTSRSPGKFNKEVEAELTKAGEICAVAQKSLYSSALESRGISASFIAALVADIVTAGQKSQHALACDIARTDATQAGHAIEEKLVASLQSIQSAARVQHLPEHPAKLEEYLVGEALANSRSLLERHSQTIIDKANAERPAGLNTDFVTRVQTERAAYVAAATAPDAEESKGKQDRAERDELLKGIVARRKKIQYAADSLWPARRPENVQARSDFKLPANRPFSY